MWPQYIVGYGGGSVPLLRLPWNLVRLIPGSEKQLHLSPSSKSRLEISSHPIHHPLNFLCINSSVFMYSVYIKLILHNENSSPLLYGTWVTKGKGLSLFFFLSLLYITAIWTVVHKVIIAYPGSSQARYVNSFMLHSFWDLLSVANSITLFGYTL